MCKCDDETCSSVNFVAFMLKCFWCYVEYLCGRFFKNFNIIISYFGVFLQCTHLSIIEAPRASVDITISFGLDVCPIGNNTTTPFSISIDSYFRKRLGSNTKISKKLMKIL